MKKYILLLLSIICAGFIHAQHNYQSENSRISCVFDQDNGSLTGLINKNTGWKVIADSKYGNSFNVRIKLPDGSIYNLNGKSQPKPQVDRNDNVITFTWKNLKHNNKDLNITFVGSVRIDEQEGLLYSGEVKNNSDAVVEELIWPYIGEVSVPDKNKKFNFQHVTYSAMAETSLYPDISNYSGGCSLPVNCFGLLNNDKEGLYISSKDADLTEFINYKYNVVPSDGFDRTLGSATAKKNHAERDNMRIEVQVDRMLFVQPHHDKKLVEVAVTPYTGSWHVAADMYKKWRATWYVTPHRPDWIKKVSAWQQLQINSSDDYLNFPYKELVSYAKDCKKYGVNAIQLTGWNLGGQDRCIPSHDVDPRLGTFDELKNAIAESQKMGVNILLFTKFTWAEVTWDGFPRYKDYVAWTRNLEDCDHGGYAYNTFTQFKGITIRRFKVLCMYDQECRDALKEEFQKCLDLGANGMVYDENQHHAGHWQCFNPNHHHDGPVPLHQGADLLGRDFQEMVQKQSPDFVMCGEGCYDLQAKYYITYARQDVLQIAASRYIDPELPVAIAVTRHNDKNKINTCLRCKYSISYEPRNFKGRLSEIPRMMEYGKKVDDLRRKYSDFLWDGEYRDVLGATVEGKDIVYSVFERLSDRKKAVVVLNTNIHDSVKATVSIDGGGQQQVMVSPEKQNPVAFSGSVSIPPQSAVVIFEK
ncbi:MAG: DUF6259 domain-containing protein [Tannerella sp.]|jgi:hypothetical protein|nr:DUF6259 domain-containing protein [Tannerella sp.]